MGTKPHIESKFPSIKTAKVNDLIPYARNSRTHSDAQVTQIASSIKEFGFTNPILTDGTGGIIAGHGRLLAAKKLGMDTVPVIELADLTEAQKRAYIIADNKLALNAGWDDEMLRVEFDELGAMGFDLDLTGFTHQEMFKIVTDKEFSPGTEDDQGKLDQLDPKMIACPNCGEEFDSRGHEK